MTDTLGVTSTQSSSKPLSDLTEIVLLLDETQSMGRYCDVTISSINEYLGTQRDTVGECNVSLVTFSKKSYSYGGAVGGSMAFSACASMPVHRSAAPIRNLNLGSLTEKAQASNEDIRPIFESENIKSVTELSRDNYRPGGWTNLYDAIGETIIATDKRIRELDHVPAVLFVIITDGEENSSRTHDLNSIQNLIKAREEDGWTFVYMGANQDAWKVGSGFGLSKGQTFTYDQNQTQEAVASLSAATTSYRGDVSQIYACNAVSGTLNISNGGTGLGSIGSSALRSSYVKKNFFDDLHDVVNNDKKD